MAEQPLVPFKGPASGDELGEESDGDGYHSAGGTYYKQRPPLQRPLFSADTRDRYYKGEAAKSNARARAAEDNRRWQADADRRRRRRPNAETSYGGFDGRYSGETRSSYGGYDNVNPRAPPHQSTRSRQEPRHKYEDFHDGGGYTRRETYHGHHKRPSRVSRGAEQVPPYTSRKNRRSGFTGTDVQWKNWLRRQESSENKSPADSQSELSETEAEKYAEPKTYRSSESYVPERGHDAPDFYSPRARKSDSSQAEQARRAAADYQAWAARQSQTRQKQSLQGSTCVPQAFPQSETPSYVAPQMVQTPGPGQQRPAVGAAAGSTHVSTNFVSAQGQDPALSAFVSDNNGSDDESSDNEGSDDEEEDSDAEDSSGQDNGELSEDEVQGQPVSAENDTIHQSSTESIGQEAEQTTKVSETGILKYQQRNRTKDLATAWGVGQFRDVMNPLTKPAAKTLDRSEYRSAMSETVVKTSDLEVWKKFSAAQCKVARKVAKDFAGCVKSDVKSDWTRVSGDKKEFWKGATSQYESETNAVYSSQTMDDESKIAWLRDYHLDPVDPATSATADSKQSRGGTTGISTAGHQKTGETGGRRKR